MKPATPGFSSIPVSSYFNLYGRDGGELAQVVERALRMCKVAGSMPAFSIATIFNCDYLFSHYKFFIIGIFHCSLQMRTLLIAVFRKFLFYIF